MASTSGNNAVWRQVKKGLMVGGTALIVGAVVWSFLPDPVPVDLATVERGRIDVTIHGEGKSRVRENYTVSAPISGRLMRIESEPGDTVEAGSTIIATMEPSDPSLLDVRTEAQAEAEIKAAEAARELAAAQLDRYLAELEFADKELARAKELAGRGTISESTLDARDMSVKTLRADVATARSNLKKAESELDLARAALISPASGDAVRAGCCVQVRSPVSGRVLRLLKESEAVVRAGEPLLELGNLGDMELVIDLLSLDAVKVEPGDEAYIDHWGGPHTLAAKVRLVEPSGFTKISALGIEEQRVNVILDITEPRDRWRNLGDGFRVEAFIIVDSRDDVMLAPVSALFRDQGQWSVFRVIDGDATLTPVKLGLRNDTLAEITSGLNVGDQLVTHPPNTVGDGSSVVDRSKM